MSLKKSIGLIGSFFCFLLLPSKINAQSIAGIINIYTPVLNVSCNTVTVVSATGFSVGDKVFIIQMKGGTVDVTNTPSFGTVLSYNGAGNNEYAYVASISGTTIELMNPLLNSYDPLGLVQLIRVPVYNTPTITGTLTAQPWNGSTGGVLVFEATTSVDFAADIDVSGLGFRGGDACTNPDGGCASFGTNLNYFYTITSGLGAEKGEGIVQLPIAQEGGRGAAANGGGGGNKHNTGGGGGGNFTKGGRGGNEFSSCSSSALGGVGGFAMDYSTGKLFLGGGGGCSDNNNMVGTVGANGGGMVIIKSPLITASGQFIKANGLDVPFIVNFIGDGAGGAGAGGTIVLDAVTISGSLNLEANGGAGGDQNSSYPSCFGPGGGGGTGVVLTSGAAMPASVLFETYPGRAGINIEPTSPCFGSNYGALAGDSSNALVTNFSIPISSIILDTPAVTVTPINCTGTTQLTVTGAIPGSSFIWSTGDTTSVISVTTSGSYTVTVSSPSLCLWNGDVNVLIDPVPDLAINLSQDTICAGEFVFLSPVSSLSGMITSYNWIYGTNTFTNTDLSDTPPVNTSYILTVIDSNGCTIADTVQVVVGPQPNASFDFDASGCAPFTVEFFTIDSTGDTYTWLTGYDNNIVLGNPASFTYPSSGVYDLGLIVSNLYCSDTLILPAVIEVFPPSDASFEYTVNTGIDFGVAFNPLFAENNTEYNWNFGDGATSNELNPFHQFESSWPDSTEVCLITNNIGECRDTFCLWVDHFNFTTLYFPNTFTPNNDGLNDVFMVVGVNVRDIKLEIYNRWGEQIYYSTGSEVSWNGKDKNGLVKSDVYVVKLSYTNLFTGIEEQKMGHLNVLK